MRLPSCQEIRRAIELYLDGAYGSERPAAAARFLPPPRFDPATWLMSAFIERDPPSAPFQNVRSFALRIGNRRYPHMKLRLSRPPQEPVYVFSVDCHDGMFKAPPGSADAEALEDLRRRNADIAADIHAAWEKEGLPTERSYLRRKIDEKKAENRADDGASA